MAVALPGYVDTGITRSVTCSASGRVRMADGYIATFRAGPLTRPWQIKGDEVSRTLNVSCPHATPLDITERALVSNSRFLSGGDVQLEIQTEHCVADGPNLRSALYNYQAVMGPFRLGVRIVTLPSSDPAPYFFIHYRIEYQWFADETTTVVETCAGFGGTTYLLNDSVTPPAAGATPIGVNPIGTLLVGLSAGTGAAAADVQIRSWVVDGTTVDTSELQTPNLHGLGGGGIDLVNLATGATASASPPYRWSYDADITKFGAGTTNARIIDQFECRIQLHADGTQKTPQSAYLTCPASNSYLVQSTSWDPARHTKSWQGAPLKFDIDSIWAAAQDPPMRTDDFRVPLYQNPALADPATAGAIYLAVTANLKASMSVEFPDGARVSHWTVNDASYGSVSETGTSTTFHVTDARAVFNRHLVHHWRTWTTTPFPKGVDAYEITKHNYYPADGLEDVWCWDAYGWLQVSVTGAAAGTAGLRIVGCQLEVNDPHTTGSNRSDDYTQTEHAFALEYPLPLTTSAASPFIDLLFPAIGGDPLGGPSYPSRVDDIEIYDLPVGDTTVTEIKLVAREDTYLKRDYGAPVQRQDYSAMHWSQDGAFQLGNWPDELYKPDEIGSHPPWGGAARYVNILTGYPSGIIQDSQYSISGWVAILNKMEAWTWSYDLAAFDAANKDTFGNRLQSELACWMRPITPHVRIPPGTDHKPNCGPVVGEMFIPNAHDFVVFTRWPVWAALEALIGRGAGTTVNAVRDDTGATVVSAATDVSGYVTLSPLPANRALQYHLSW